MAGFLNELSEIVDLDFTKDMCTMETDASLHKVRGAVGIILQSLDGIRVSIVVQFIFSISNNEGIYKAILLGLRTT